MTKRKKILFLTNWYPNIENPNLGIFVKRHAEAVNDFADVTVMSILITPSKKIFSKQIKRIESQDVDLVLNIKIKSIFWKLLTYSPYFQYITIKKSIKKLNSDKFDFVQSNILFMSGIVGMKISKSLGIPRVHVEHWSGVNNFLSNNIYKNMGLKSLEKADAIVCVSDFLKKDFDNRIDEKKFHIIGNVLNEQFAPIEKKKSETYNFLAVAYWEEPKNPELFLDALCILAENGNKIRLSMVGDGVLLDTIKNKTYPFEINFVGPVKNEDLAEYFHAADILLHSSHYETFSIVPLESILTGTPVVVSKVGVLPQIVNDQNGVLCDSSIDSWVSGIKRVMDTNYTAKEISQTIKDKFSRQTISGKFQKLYEEISRK